MSPCISFHLSSTKGYTYMVEQYWQYFEISLFIYRFFKKREHFFLSSLLNFNSSVTRMKEKGICAIDF